MNYLGIKEEDALNLANKMNVLLANYAIFNMNVKGMHWNIKGHAFFVLHVKLEEIYEDLSNKIDEVAERILSIGFTPKHSYTTYRDLAEIRELTDVSDAKSCMQALLNGYEIILKHERIILAEAQEKHDEGTVAMLSGYLPAQEKTVWMLKSWLD